MPLISSLPEPSPLVWGRIWWMRQPCGKAILKKYRRLRGNWCNSSPPPAPRFGKKRMASVSERYCRVPEISPVSPTLSFALRSRLDPRHIVLGDIELLELSPRGDGLCTRRPLIGSEELRYEVDVATVRDPLESLHLVQDNVLPDEIAVGGVLVARELLFSPAVQAIPDPGLLTNLRRQPTGLLDDEVLGFT